MADSGKIRTFPKDPYGGQKAENTNKARTGGLRARLLRALRRQPADGSQFRDYSLLFIILFLLGFGLVMLYSTSSYSAIVDYGDSAFYFRKQLIFTLMGLGLMVFVSFIPYRWYRVLSVPAYLAAAGLIFLIIPFGNEGGGAKRWLEIFGMNLQPAEVAKVAVIMLTATIIEREGRKELASTAGLLKPLIPSAIMAVMIWKITDNLSSAIIVLAITMGMLFVACPDYKRFVVMAGAVGVSAFLLVSYIVNAADRSTMEFRGRRILAWLDPIAYEDISYQTVQALYAIGSGGFLGKGLGQSMQKMIVPEAQNDMIFSIICEELGLFGAIGIMFMFILLIWRFMAIANNAEDMYGAMLVVGVISHIAVQVVLNISVVTNTMPNTGVTLPFFSYGGSSIFFLMAEIGIVLSVSRGIRFRKTEDG